MSIIILTLITGILIAITPFALKNFVRGKLPPLRKSYWLAGAYFLTFTFLYSAIIERLAEQNFFGIPDYASALLIALIIALFTELGRFFLLDKIIKIKAKNDIIEFGTGYLSFSTVFLGLSLILSSAIYFYFSRHPNISVDFAALSKNELANIKVLQEVALNYIQENPLIALTPLLERAAEYMLSVYFTFLIAGALVEGKQSKIWLAVLIRLMFVFLIFWKPFGEEAWNEIFSLVIQVLVLAFGFFELKKLLKSKESLL